ncbi:hypothetical protein [Teichococcus vastitatis]|uniref:hypothetical protein n=1 Tax=Teichococcus vastitatis TaxID=2307076 RepID=UPI000E718DA1|nr:hypothetical protein [Pseudoroseomonas vastitatis]
MTKFPPITDEIRQAGKKVELNLKPRPELPDESIEANSRSIGERYGSNTQITAEAVRPTLRPSAPPPPQMAPLTSVRFDCPNYLDKELAVRAAEEGVTKTYLILKALGAAGFRLDSADLVKDRRRIRR